MKSISVEELRAELKRGEKPKEMVCLGCAAKVELVETIYPVLRKLSDWLTKNTSIKLQPRDDVYIASSDGSYQVIRSKYKIKDIEAGLTANITSEFAKYKPNGIVLVSNFLPFPSQERLFEIFKKFYEAAAKGHKNFTVGKGHTIQIAKHPDEEYLIIEFFTFKDGSKHLVANNDTISNIDPNLRYTSWVTITIALNNSLNDLFLCGVHENITIFPTCDIRDPDSKKELFESLNFYKKRFPEYNLSNADILGFNTKSIGATVVGISNKEITRNNNLKGGEILIATRPIGDLAPLTEFLIRQLVNEETTDIASLREHVLETMLLPNIEIAKIIKKFLPDKGNNFDPDKHIISCRDMSGPGLMALEELAEDSDKDISLDNIVLHNEAIANVEMPNPTSGTNGAIIIACFDKVANTVLNELGNIGLQPWVIGKVLKKQGTNPVIKINKQLTKYPFIKGYKRSIFQHYVIES